MKIYKNMSKRTRTLLISISAPLLFVVAFVVVVVVYNAFHTPPEIDVTASGFVQQNVTTQTITINEGESINFVNRSSMMVALCLGKNQKCDNVAVDPKALAHPGFQLVSGQSKVVAFQNPGTFYITCTTIPKLNLTVTVSQAV